MEDNKKQSLWAIAEMHKSIINQLIESEGEIDDETFNLLNETKENGLTKMRSIFYLYDTFKAERDKAEMYKKIAIEREKQCQSKLDRLEYYLAQGLIAFTDSIDKPILEVTTDTGIRKLSFRKSTQVDVINEAELSNDYKLIDVVTKIDKVAIKHDLEAGIEVKGAELVTKNNLQIK